MATSRRLDSRTARRPPRRNYRCVARAETQPPRYCLPDPKIIAAGGDQERYIRTEDYLGQWYFFQLQIGWLDAGRGWLKRARSSKPGPFDYSRESVVAFRQRIIQLRSRARVAIDDDLQSVERALQLRGEGTGYPTRAPLSSPTTAPPARHRLPGVMLDHPCRTLCTFRSFRVGEPSHRTSTRPPTRPS
jgi:hypothetical protein